MEKDWKFMNNNIGYFFQDIIDKYDFRIIKVDDSSSLLINGNYCFYIIVSRGDSQVHYIYKEKLTNKYFMLFCYYDLYRYMDREKRMQNLANCKINFYNGHLNEFVYKMPYQISIINSLYRINNMIKMVMEFYPDDFEPWLKENFEGKIGESSVQLDDIVSNKLQKYLENSIRKGDKNDLFN